MADRSELLNRYLQVREILFRYNNLLVKTIPKETLDECGRILGFLREGVLSFETEDEMSVLMDYCLYSPGPDGRSLVAKYLEKPPTSDPRELSALQNLAHAYYSLFEVVEAERGIGVQVRDLLRGETGFIVDVGFGNSSHPHMILATRIVPMEGALMTGGAGLPVDRSTLKRIIGDLIRMNRAPGTFDFNRITPAQEAEVAATMIRACRATGMAARIVYQTPTNPALPPPGSARVRRTGRNEPCPCGSGKKFKLCCGRVY